MKDHRACLVCEGNTSYEPLKHERKKNTSLTSNSSKRISLEKSL